MYTMTCVNMFNPYTQHKFTCRIHCSVPKVIEEYSTITTILNQKILYFA